MKELVIENIMGLISEKCRKFPPWPGAQARRNSRGDENSRYQGLEYTKNGPSSAHDAAIYRLLILLHDRKDSSKDQF